MGRLGGFDILISTCTLESPHRLLRATTARCHGVAVKGVNIPVGKKMKRISWRMSDFKRISGE